MTKETTVRHFISFLITFVATFLLVFSLGLSSDTFVFSKDALLSLGVSALISAIRSLAKIIYEITYDYLQTK